MSSKTTTTVAPPSAEEKAYLTSQQDLAAKQLELLTKQGAFQEDYLNSVKPLLDQQTQFQQQSLQQQGDYLKSIQPSIDANTALLKQQLDQQTASLNDPVQKEIQSRANDLILKQLSDQSDLAPLQKKLLQTQLDQALNGNKPTQDQLDSIDQATKSAYDTGISDINSFSSDAMRQLRDNLAPSLGLRPGDTPILDRGALVEREAARQAGQLTSNLAGVSANARLNLPLASQQLNSTISGNQASIGNAAQTFQAQLADAANQNRLNLMSSAGNSFGLGLNGGGAGGTSNAVNLGLSSGSPLIAAARANPLSFQRGGTSTVSDPWGYAMKGIAGLGQALSGTSLSDKRLKTDIKTAGFDAVGRRWVNFRYRGDPKHQIHTGLLAQETEKTDPHAVLTNGLGIKFIDYSKLETP